MQRTRARAPVRPRRNYAAVLRLRAELSLRLAVNQTPCVKGTALASMQRRPVGSAAWANRTSLFPSGVARVRSRKRIGPPSPNAAADAPPPPATFRLMPRASLRCSGACRGAHASQGKFPVERLWERPNSVWALCGKKACVCFCTMR